MSHDKTLSIEIVKTSSDRKTTVKDLLAVEEPLEIRILYGKTNQRKEKNISVTMRTPGNDEELAVGFLFTEGIISSFDQVEKISHPADNIITIVIKEGIDLDLSKLDRNFYTTSSCGVCGKSSIDAVRISKGASNENRSIAVASSVIYQLPSTLRMQQNVFEQTGGLHASAIFNITGELISLKEDVGRHNALDKLIGESLKKNMTSMNEYILLLSGRASFELIQKASMAEINIIAAVGAPSSLAVELAKERDMTLVGFLKKDSFNIYCGGQRIKFD